MVPGGTLVGIGASRVIGRVGAARFRGACIICTGILIVAIEGPSSQAFSSLAEVVDGADVVIITNGHT